MIRIILNINPAQSYEADLIYVANESLVTAQGVPSFVAEASWVNKQPLNTKLGLKGTAILYGDRVSLFYFIIRKPWATARHYVGL